MDFLFHSKCLLHAPAVEISFQFSFFALFIAVLCKILIPYSSKSYTFFSACIFIPDCSDHLCFPSVSFFWETKSYTDGILYLFLMRKLISATSFSLRRSFCLSYLFSRTMCRSHAARRWFNNS